MKNNLLVLLFIVGGIYLIKEYLVAVRIVDMKEVIFAVNTFLLKHSLLFVSPTRKREFEYIFNKNVACTLSTKFCHRKAIITNSDKRPFRGHSSG